MTFYEILILAFAMAIDCTIVSFSYGLLLTENRLKNSLKFAFSFALFQTIMPIIGWFLTGIVYNKLEAYSKWIVFAIFMYLGFKFIQSAFSKEEKKTVSCITFVCLLGLSVATSIDALGAGISIRFININIWLPAIIIGLISFIMSLIGFWISALFKKLPSKVMEIAGALLLIYLAIKAVL